MRNTKMRLHIKSCNIKMVPVAMFYGWLLFKLTHIKKPKRKHHKPPAPWV